MPWDPEEERKAARNMSIGAMVFMLLGGLSWCAVVISMGAWPLLLFGLLFVGLAVYRLVIYIRLSSKKKNDPSGKSPRKDQDPWDLQSPSNPQAGNRCPYCGTALDENFQFCPSCGRRLS